MRFLRSLGIALGALTGILLVGPFLIPIPPLENTVPPETLADPDGQFIGINGLKVHYKTKGSGKQAIILLHGFGASVFSWREVIGPLSEIGRVVAYDRPAFGLTQRPIPGEWQGESSYTPQAQVDLLFGLMDQLGIKQAILIGNSAGGSVAMNAALQNPQRVQALVLVDPAVYENNAMPAFVRPILETPQMDRLGILLSRSIATRGMDILTSAWHDQAKLTPFIIENYRKPLLADHWDAALWQLTCAAQTSHLPERLAEFRLPILVVTGDDDRIVPTANTVRLAGELPEAQLLVFEGCGHVPQEECPQAFLAAVRPFIEKIQNTSISEGQ
jgi:pimeloyl-ACP methyl ester carboxylesterase